MIFRLFLSLIALVLAMGCQPKVAENSASPEECDSSVKTTWDDINEETRKTTEYWNSVMKTCSEKRLQLTNFEKGLDLRRRANIACKPQAIGSAWLKADSNFYSYRNGRVMMELDSATGQFRRLTFGETTSGALTVSKDLGCFFIRSDTEIEPVSPRDYGSQLLLDLGPLAASTESVRPIEIFKYTRVGDAWQMMRFDQNDDIDYSFCSDSLVPSPYCDQNRNGNPYFESDLDDATKADLLQQALLIRSEHNFSAITKSEFDRQWSQSETGNLESPIQSWKYSPTMFVDVPNYVWSTWADYIRGDRAAMPDVFALNLPALCYPAKRAVTYNDGTSGFIWGTACYDGVGGYQFQ